MSTNDLISRSKLLAKYDRQHEGPAGKARKLIEDAPGEMSVVEYLKERNRMESWGAENCNRASFECDDWCCECPYDQAPSCADEANRPLEAIAIVEKWAREHPEENDE